MAIEKTVTLRVKSNAGDVEKDFEDIKKEIKQVEQVAKNANLGEKEFKKVANEIQNTEKSALSVKQQLKQLTDQMAMIGDVGSPEFQKLAKEAGVLRDKMNNARAAIDSMANDFPRLQVGVQAFTAIGSAASVGMGAVQAFGSENEDLMRGMQKLMAIQAMLNGVQTLANTLSDESALGLKIRTVLTEINTKAEARLATVTGVKTGVTIAATKAMAALNVVMSLNPVLLLVTGVAALVGALMWLTSEEEKAEEMNNRINAAYEKTIALLNKITAATQARLAHELKMLEITGASEEELHKKRLQNMEEERKLRKHEFEIEKALISDKQKAYNRAIEEGNNEKAKEIKNDILESKKRYDDLLQQHQQYLYDKQQENAQYAADEKQRLEDEKKEEEANYKERLDKWKQYQADRLAAARQIEDLRLQNLYDNENKQLEELRVSLERQKQDTLANESLLQEEKAALIAEYEEAARQKRNAIIEENKIALETRTLEQLSAEQMVIDQSVQLYAAGEEAKTSIADSHWGLRVDAAMNATAKMEEQSKAYVDTAMQGLQALDDLNSLLTDNAVKKAGANEAAQEAARKKGFERSKKIQLVMAIITGIQGVMAAFTAGSSMGPAGVVMGPVMAALAAVTAGINVAKIASMKYEGGGAGGGGGASVPSGGGGGGATPSFNIVGQGGTNQILEGLNQKPTKSYVVSTEVTTQQSLDRNRSENATFG